MNEAVVSAFVLRIEIVSNVVPPTKIEELENAFAMIGLDGVTLSTSAWLQEPAGEHEVFVLLTFELLTDAGGEITAVLVTCGWDRAGRAHRSSNKGRSRNIPVRTTKPNVLSRNREGSKPQNKVRQNPQRV